HLRKLSKKFYYSEYGPMINAHIITHSLPEWGEKLNRDKVAFTYRDANAKTAVHFIDQWLGMGRSSNLSQFKSVFADCGTVFWVNTLYSDKEGNAYYADGSSVPNLSKAATLALKQRIVGNKLQKA